jgi:hypothetical protein
VTVFYHWRLAWMHVLRLGWGQLRAGLDWDGGHSPAAGKWDEGGGQGHCTSMWERLGASCRWCPTPTTTPTTQYNTAHTGPGHAMHV